MLILLTGKAHLAGVNVEEFCQRVRHEAGVAAVFQNAHQDVLAFAVRLKTQIFHYHEIFRVGFQQTLALRFAVQIRQVVEIRHLTAFTSSATASQAMPSPRPVKPSFSVVVALTLTSSIWQPRSSAINTRI